MKKIPLFVFFKILLGIICFSPYLNAQSLPVQILGNRDFCPNGNTTLDAGNGYATYNWSSGATTRFIFVQVGGTYSVTVTDATGNTGRNSVVITEHPNPTPAISGRLFKCPNRPTALDAGGGYRFYNWNTGETAQGIAANATGDYKVTVTNEYGCQGSATTTVVAGLPVIMDVPNEIRLCGNDTATLNATSAGAVSYLWNDNWTEPIKIVRDSGIYNVIVTNGQCVGYDTCRVYRIPPPTVDIGKDTILCLGEHLDINAQQWGVSHYQWSDGGTAPNRTIWQDGFYKLTIRFGNCVASDSIQVQLFNKKPMATLDTVICDTVYKWTPKLQGALDYKWSTGADTSTLFVKKTGDYQVKMSNGRCHVDWNYKLTFKKTPQIDLGRDTFICLAQANHYTLNAFWQFSTLKWQDSTTFATYLAEPPGGTYQVKVSNECGMQSDSVQVHFYDCNKLYVPNVFSPNGDNINDYFQLYPTGFVDKINYFRVFQRAGNLVFSAVDFKTDEVGVHAWDGTFGGRVLDTGVYVYVLSFTAKDGKTWVQSGDVTLLK